MTEFKHILCPVDFSDSSRAALDLAQAQAREGSSTRALILRGVKEILKTDRRKARVPVSLPIVRSKRPGTVAIDNARIYDIAFP